MSGADSPEILAAYDAVRSNTDPTNWLLISYVGAVGDKLQLTKTGSGGLEELKEALDDTQAQYAYLRLEYANDSEACNTSYESLKDAAPSVFLAVTFLAFIMYEYVLRTATKNSETVPSAPISRDGNRKINF